MVDFNFRAGVRGLAIVATAGLLTACGGGGGDAAGASPTGSTTPPTATSGAQNQAPTIAGTAPATAEVGAAYVFTPTASDPDRDSLSFSIASKPTWAVFNSTTGRLSGTPAEADVGTHEEIQIAASDGKTSTQLPPFTITVETASATSGNVTLSWTPPATNTDGTALTNLSGYKLHYGTATQQYTQTIDITNVGVTNYVVENLDNGTYFFSITAVSGTGTESEYSSEVIAKIG